jgi:hypothetical protein
MENKRKKLTISDKLNVIGEVEARQNVPRIEMTNRLGLPPSTLSKIMLSKEKITDAEYKCGAQAKKRKYMKLGASNELEKILLECSNKCIQIMFPLMDPSFKRRQMKLHFALI